MTSKYLRQHKRRYVNNDPMLNTEVGSVFYISKTLNGKNYYVEEDERQGGNILIVWNTDRARALQFHTEDGVYYYINTRMSGRKDIFITSAKPEGNNYASE